MRAERKRERGSERVCVSVRVCVRAFYCVHVYDRGRDRKLPSAAVSVTAQGSLVRPPLSVSEARVGITNLHV